MIVASDLFQCRELQALAVDPFSTNKQSAN